jgi:hypothetical protein
MYRQIVHAFGGFHDGLADGWVRVDDAAEFITRLSLAGRQACHSRVTPIFSFRS